MHRSIWLAILLLTLFVTNALADTVTLPSGEQVQIEQSGNTTRITLANGATVTRSEAGSTSSWGAAASVSNADFDKAQEAYDLWRQYQPQPRERSIPVWAGLLVIAIGLFNLLAPQVAWYLSDGWKFRDAEPSDAAITMHRIGGAVGLAVGLFILLFG